jgi:hypothetical protein
MKKSLLKFIVCNLFVLSSWSALAQFPGSEDSSGTGNLESTDSQAPISDYLIPMLVVGVLFGFYIYKKKLNSIKN